MPDILEPTPATAASLPRYPNAGPAATVVPRPTVINVDDYGAVGDDSTDDTAALLAAMAATPVGGTLTARAGGVYRTSQPLQPGHQTTIDFQGAALRIGATRSGATQSNDAVVLVAVRTGVTIRNVRFLAPSSVFAGGGDRATVYMTAALRCVVEDCFFDSPGDGAIIVKGSTSDRNTIQRNYVIDGSISYAVAGASRTTCRNNVVEQLNPGPENCFTGSGNGGGSIYNEYCLVEGNIARGSRDMAIEDQGQTRGTIIRNNLIESPAYFGISAVGQSPLVEGNTIIDPGTVGIEVGASGARVIGNTVRFVAATAGDGIRVDSSGAAPYTGITVANNAVAGCDIGIRCVNYPSSISVTGNVVTDWRSRGIDVGGDACTVVGNTLRQTNPTNLLRFGIQTSGPATITANNVLLYKSTAGGGSAADIAIKMTSDSALISGNTVDGGGITSPSVVSITGGTGATYANLRILNNYVFNSATINLGSLATPIVDGNTGTIVGASSIVAGFYAKQSAPVAKPTVSGAKGSNAAVASLLNALADLGLITDSTTT